MDPSLYRDIVRRALEEDVGSGDITTDAIVDPAQQARGVFIAKAPCIVAGMDVVIEVFAQLEPSVRTLVRVNDGQACEAGAELAVVTGAARTLLVGERTALNFLQRLSGIATITRQFVDRAGGRITVLDTRKTTPGLRMLEKHAVIAGGGTNYRTGLFDAVLIKDNHIRIAGGVRNAVALVRKARPDAPIEIEAQSLGEADEALDVGVDVLLADNLGTDAIVEIVRRARGRARVEISGGVILERMPELAATGADLVSVGALTHSAPAIDISFEIEPL